MLFSSRVRVRIWVRIGFRVWLVSCQAHVFVLLQVEIVTLPTMLRWAQRAERRLEAVLPVGRFFRQIGLVLETVGGEILRFGGWLVLGLVLNDVCWFFGRLVAITVDNAYASLSASASHIV